MTDKQLLDKIVDIISKYPCERCQRTSRSILDCARYRESCYDLYEKEARDVIEFFKSLNEEKKELKWVKKKPTEPGTYLVVNRDCDKERVTISYKELEYPNVSEKLLDYFAKVNESFSFDKDTHIVTFHNTLSATFSNGKIMPVFALDDNLYWAKEN